MIVYYVYIQHPTVENKVKSIGHIYAKDADQARAIAWSQNMALCKKYVTKLGWTLEVEAQGGT